MKDISLNTKYKLCAKQALIDKVDAGNEIKLVKWIRTNCQYDNEYEFFLVLGIGSELADLHAQIRGYDNEVHRVFEMIKRKE